MNNIAVPKSPGRPPFITFEGGEGVGKSTQIKMLAQRLNAAGYSTITTREPGGSPGAEIMRHLLLSGVGKLLGPEVEAILFAAARDDHTHNVILPALKAGSWVLCDRFYDSTRAYQGSLGTVPADIIDSMRRVTIGDLKPDLTIILDLPVELGLERVRRRGGTPDRFETEDVGFHQRLRDLYCEIAAQEPERCVLVDANAQAEAIAGRIWVLVQQRILGVSTVPVHPFTFSPP